MRAFHSEAGTAEGCAMEGEGVGEDSGGEDVVCCVWLHHSVKQSSEMYGSSAKKWRKGQECLRASSRRESRSLGVLVQPCSEEAGLEKLVA